MISYGKVQIIAFQIFYFSFWKQEAERQILKLPKLPTPDFAIDGFNLAINFFINYQSKARSNVRPRKSDKVLLSLWR